MVATNANGGAKPRTPAREAVLFAALAEGLSLNAACKRLDCSAALVYHWARKDKAFAARLAAARPARVAVEQRKRRMTAAERERIRKGWCADKACGACRWCGMRERALKRRADGTFLPKGIPRPNAWQAAEDALLRRVAGRLPRYEIASLLLAECGTQRTLGAVTQRAADLGLSVDAGAHLLSTDAVARLFGSDHCSVRRLVALGLLTPRRTSDSPWATRLFDPRDLEAFMRAHPWAYDPDALDDSRLGKLGKVLHRSDPWLTIAAASAALGFRSDSGLAKWDGRVEMTIRRRLLGSRGGRKEGVRVVRRADLPRIAERIEELRREAMRSRLAKAQAGRRRALGRAA